MLNLTSVRIGAIDYTVENVPDLIYRKKKCDGHIDYGHSTIELEHDMSDQVKTQTLIHEILHGICTQGGLNVEEQEIDVLAYGIYQVMRDNPDLVAQITGKATKNGTP